MYDLAHWAGLAATVLALISAGYALGAVCLAGRFKASRETALVKYPPVTLLKPLHLDEPRLRENLESFCRQNYSAPVQLVFGVQDPLDPAIKIVESLKRQYPKLDIELVVDTRLYGANRKVSNLINLVERAKYDVLVLSDSDIEVGSDYLCAVTNALAQARGGAVTCVYSGAPLDNIWSRFVAMGINYQFIPNALFGTTLGLAAPCFGSTIALHKDLLRRIGGMQAFADLLADDYEIGRAVRALGHSMTLAPIVVSHTCGEHSRRDLFNHELRWARTVRLLNTSGHFGTFVTHALPLALIAMAINGVTILSAAVLGTALLARLSVKWRMDRVLDTSAGPAWLLPARDMLSFVIFLGSLAGGNIHWRGTRFLVAADGVLSHQ